MYNAKSKPVAVSNVWTDEWKWRGRPKLQLLQEGLLSNLYLDIEIMIEFLPVFIQSSRQMKLKGV
jgi:hypothetical protein